MEILLILKKKSSRFHFYSQKVDSVSAMLYNVTKERESTIKITSSFGTLKNPRKHSQDLDYKKQYYHCSGAF